MKTTHPEQIMIDITGDDSRLVKTIRFYKEGKWTRKRFVKRKMQSSRYTNAYLIGDIVIVIKEYDVFKYALYCTGIGNAVIMVRSMSCVPIYVAFHGTNMLLCEEERYAFR